MLFQACQQGKEADHEAECSDPSIGYWFRGLWLVRIPRERLVNFDGESQGALINSKEKRLIPSQKRSRVTLSPTVWFLWKDQQHRTGNNIFILLNTKTRVLPLCTAQRCVSAFPSHPSPRRQHTTCPPNILALKYQWAQRVKTIEYYRGPSPPTVGCHWTAPKCLVTTRHWHPAKTPPPPPPPPRGIEKRGGTLFHWTGASICWRSLILKQTLNANVAVYNSPGNQQMLTFHAEGLHVASWEARRFWPPLILVWLISVIKLWEPTEADVPLMKNLMPNTVR